MLPQLSCPQESQADDDGILKDVFFGEALDMYAFDP